MEPRIAPVTELSGSSDSDTEWLPQKEKAQSGRSGRHRRRSSLHEKKKRPKVNELVQVQAMLSKECKGGCRTFFRSKTGKEELLKFRNEWVSLHKTDQDTVVFWLGFQSIFSWGSHVCLIKVI